jgi:predicted nucleotidyltransferase
MHETGHVDPDKLREIVRRIVEVADPERIVMFGSAARGEMRPDSDVDLLVIKAGVHRRHLAEDIHERMVGVGQPVDIVVATPDDIARYGESPVLVYRPALREGTVVYIAE